MFIEPTFDMHMSEGVQDIDMSLFFDEEPIVLSDWALDMEIEIEAMDRE